jgi:dTDP-4-dehydrorhamnose reductase
LADLLNIAEGEQVLFGHSLPNDDSSLAELKSFVKELFPNMKIILFGARGQVGTALKKALPSTYQLFPSHNDITHHLKISKELDDIKPAIIINAAAYTHVDNAEKDKDKAFEVNAVAPMHLAQWALKNNALLVHFSTDYVFDGSGYSPWSEDDKPSPLNVYGSTKLEGDVQIINSDCHHLIIRTSWVYGTSGHNFIRSILKHALIKNKISVVSDQIGAPISADFLAEITYKMIDKSINHHSLLGLYHVSPKGEVSWADYAKFILDKAGLSSSVDVLPILSKDYHQTANRPLNSRLDTRKLQKNFGIVPPDWKQDVLKIIHAIHKETDNEHS